MHTVSSYGDVIRAGSTSPTPQNCPEMKLYDTICRSEEGICLQQTDRGYQFGNTHYGSDILIWLEKTAKGYRSALEKIFDPENPGLITIRVRREGRSESSTL